MDWRDPSWKGLVFYQLAIGQHCQVLAPSLPQGAGGSSERCPQDTGQEGHGSTQPSWPCSLVLLELVPIPPASPLLPLTGPVYALCPGRAQDLAYLGRQHPRFLRAPSAW